MKFAHFFLPHPETHKKAHFISIPALVSYIILFLFLQLTFNLIGRIDPDILGISSNVSQQELIKLTNLERQKSGLPPLKENHKLNQAAYLKGQNMFEENYWAHYSPSGKDPWGFIVNSGYKFSYAGENLARNFYNSPDIVNAWMASTTHKENILNSNYQEIGIAVLEGNLQGQPTVLIVQEFGKPVDALAEVKIAASASNPAPKPEVLQLAKLENTQPILTANFSEEKQNKFSIDPYLINRNLALGLLLFVGVLLLLDLYILRRRAIHIISSHHLPHLAFISVAAGTIINSSRGAIL